MKISRLRIQNFRSIKDLEIELGDTTVLIGQNNAGKTAILDAVRIALTRRWGHRGTGFTENDVHRSDEKGDPKVLPPVTISVTMIEPSAGTWDQDMVAALEDIIALTSDGRNTLTLRVTCAWSPEKEAFDPVWEFLDAAGTPLTGKSQRATNLTGFFSYVPLFWLGALRDASDEFTPRSGHWGRILKSVRIPQELEADALRILAELDTRILAADPRLASIAGLIGQATQVAIGDNPGAARLNTLPATVEEMLQRTGVVLRNEAPHPWLPLMNHGQGIQSLAVIFLFEAAVLQHLREAEMQGVDPVYAIEEPETHLHPQAARALWRRVQKLSGQKLMTSHSPYFVHHVPIRDLRLVRLCDGCTKFSSIPAYITSDLPWTVSTDRLMHDPVASQTFVKDRATSRVAVRRWFDERMADALAGCYRNDERVLDRAASVRTLRHSCRILPSREDEDELAFHGRRVRGEIFFARRWILVEGVSEYLLIHALADALGWSMDAHGVVVIDFQQSGSPGVYATLADAFGIPWRMILDGDGGGDGFREQLVKRGFRGDELSAKVVAHTRPNDLEDQLLADGHEQVLREVLAGSGVTNARTCDIEELRRQLKKRKTDYMGPLAQRVAKDDQLARRMPPVFVGLVSTLMNGAA